MNEKVNEAGDIAMLLAWWKAHKFQSLWDSVCCPKERAVWKIPKMFPASDQRPYVVLTGHDRHDEVTPLRYAQQALT